jgi:hypothetical protein
MDKPALTTPVALIIFNRPEVTRRVFEAVRKARPAKLLLIADGPRPSRPDDAENCRLTREIVTDVDWPCEVLTNFSETNIGCKRRVAGGLDWVFAEVEDAIILEDDCLPHPDFFPFCAEMLEKYRHDDRVFHISGNHFRTTGERNPESYYFSRYTFSWGWATWRRAWKYFDVDIKLWPVVRDGGWLRDFLGDAAAARRFTREFQAIYDGKVNTVWDFQWGLACWIHSGLAIRPHVNLISNIGFSDNATHTKDPDYPGANLPTAPMEFPLRHPAFMMRNAFEDKFFHGGTAAGALWRRAKGKFKKVFESARHAGARSRLVIPAQPETLPPKI